ncbi:MAG: hypothetical protein DMF64_15820 [Acidobacteria bacterium]|nr:MAG: hypothetical protein DMF64_15820 [Acidobacteriota bacterium]
MPEEPVIVSGGSVTVAFNHDSFKEETGKDGKKQHKHGGGRLRRVEVNGRKVADLNETDKVEIIYEY